MQMKSRLAAYIHFLSAGNGWMNTSAEISTRSVFTAFDRRHGQIDCSSMARRFESSNRAVHSAALEDDAFSELGPGESECSLGNTTIVAQKLDDLVDDDASSESDPGILNCHDKKIKLVTEKHDAFLDDDVSLELDPGTSECSTEKTKLVTEEPDDFMGDAFSELGPGIAECSVKQIKLVTEKRDPFSKTQSHIRESAGKPLASDYRANAKDLLTAIARVSKTSSAKSDALAHAPNAKKLFGGASSTKASTASSTKASTASSTKASTASSTKSSTASSNKTSTISSTEVPSPVHVPASTDDAKKVAEREYLHSVSIKNVPSNVSLPELIEAISVFGKVSGASFVTKSEKLKCCNIVFEDADSSRRAILAGKVEVGSSEFLVNSLGAVDLFAIRINNISEKTADSAIHSVCKSVGELVGLTRTSKDGADAFFYVPNDKSLTGIIKKLNKTVLDLNRWSAQALKSIPNSSEAPSDEDTRYNMEQQIYNKLKELRKEASSREMNMQDLEYLIASIMHIREGTT